MRLVSLKEFRALIYSPASAPGLETLRARVRAGKIAGGMIDAGHYYVDLDEFDRTNRLAAQLADQRRRLEKNPVLQGLL